MSYQNVPDVHQSDEGLIEIEGVPTVSPAPLSWNRPTATAAHQPSSWKPTPRMTLSAVSLAAARDFAFDFFLVGAVSVVFAVWGGWLFLSEETALAVASFADDDGVIESVEGTDVLSVRRSLSTSVTLFSSPKRLIGLLLQTTLLPLGCACLGMFALQSYKVRDFSTFFDVQDSWHATSSTETPILLFFFCLLFRLLLTLTHPGGSLRWRGRQRAVSASQLPSLPRRVAVAPLDHAAAHLYRPLWRSRHHVLVRCFLRRPHSSGRPRSGG
jgi:hypothetical protein